MRLRPRAVGGVYGIAGKVIDNRREQLVVDGDGTEAGARALAGRLREKGIKPVRGGAQHGAKLRFEDIGPLEAEPYRTPSQLRVDLFRDLKVFSLAADISEDNVFEFFWQALVGGATSLFKNFSRDQFGTLIPFTADVSGATTADILATLGNILRNAFVRAYLPRLQSGEESVGDLKFSAPEITDPLSAGDSQ